MMLTNKCWKELMIVRLALLIILCTVVNNAVHIIIVYLTSDIYIHTQKNQQFTQKQNVDLKKYLCCDQYQLHLIIHPHIWILFCFIYSILGQVLKLKVKTQRSNRYNWINHWLLFATRQLYHFMWPENLSLDLYHIIYGDFFTSVCFFLFVIFWQMTVFFVFEWKRKMSVLV